MRAFWGGDGPPACVRAAAERVESPPPPLPRKNALEANIHSSLMDTLWGGGDEGGVEMAGPSMEASEKALLPGLEGSLELSLMDALWGTPEDDAGASGQLAGGESPTLEGEILPVDVQTSVVELKSMAGGTSLAKQEVQTATEIVAVASDEAQQAKQDPRAHSVPAGQSTDSFRTGWMTRSVSEPLLDAKAAGGKTMPPGMTGGPPLRRPPRRRIPGGPEAASVGPAVCATGGALPARGIPGRNIDNTPAGFAYNSPTAARLVGRKMFAGEEHEARALRAIVGSGFGPPRPSHGEAHGKAHVAPPAKAEKVVEAPQEKPPLPADDVPAENLTAPVCLKTPEGNDTADEKLLVFEKREGKEDIKVIDSVDVVAKGGERPKEGQRAEEVPLLEKNVKGQQGKEGQRPEEVPLLEENVKGQQGLTLSGSEVRPGRQGDGQVGKGKRSKVPLAFAVVGSAAVFLLRSLSR